MFGITHATVRDILGNAVFGPNSGVIVQTTVIGAPPEQPTIPWRDWLPGADIPSTLNLLTWRSRLSKSLIGRELDMSRLLAWARDDPRPIALRVLSGPGGIGKSRLAVEVAAALRSDSWSTGLIDLNTTAALPIAKAGLFVAIDYPEANREAVIKLFRAAGRLEWSKCKIRLLLVSRHAMKWWENDINIAHASELCDSQDASIRPLSPELTCKLIREVSGQLAIIFGKGTPPLDDEVIIAWHARNPQQHGLPLFATAAAVHLMLDHSLLRPGVSEQKRVSTFGLGGTKLIEALVERERGRFNAAALQAGWRRENALGQDKAAGRLHGLAALTGGLDEMTIKHLAQVATDMGLPPPEEVVDKVDALGWMVDGKVPAIQPDLAAAELLYQILIERPQAAPEWLAVTLSNPGVLDAERLGRLMHDIATLRGDSAAKQISSWLIFALKGHPDLAATWEPLLHAETINYRVAPLSVAIGNTLLSMHGIDDEKRGDILHSLANCHRLLGDQEDALRHINAAIKVRHGLAELDASRFEPGLARSWHLMSRLYRDIHASQPAFEANERALEIRTRLARADAQFEPDYAESLSNVGSYRTDLDKNNAFLSIAKNACLIYRDLVTKYPGRFESNLARALLELSNRVLQSKTHTNAQRWSEAADIITELIAINEELVAKEPDRYEPDLAMSLRMLAYCQSNAGRWAAAIHAVHRSVLIYEGLYSSNPNRFEIDLARSKMLEEKIRHRKRPGHY